MSLFSTFSNSFKQKPKTKTQPKKQTQPAVDPHIQQLVADAQKRSKEILEQAKAEAKIIEQKTQEELANLHQQFAELNTEYDKRQKSVSLQESILQKKTQHVEKLTKIITDSKAQIEQTKEQLIENLSTKSQLSVEEAQDILRDTFQTKIDNEAQKELHYKEEEVEEQAETIARNVLTQVMKHGSFVYHSDYTPPIIVFETPQEEAKILGKDQENLRFLEELTQVEITFDPEMHQLKLYCFNTIKREVARVLIERLKKGGVVTQAKIRQLFEQSSQELNRDMFQAGTYLCHQLNIFNLPKEIVQTLGMFKYRYSYGQNMIIHTLEEAKIGIALAHELKVDTNVVRLGCLFHDIGKVIYDDDNNHVESGVQFLRKFNMPEVVVACVAESHEDIPFSSVESMIVHVADSISGARPGARFDDYEGFLKHQQGLIDIAMSHKGVTEAFVINGGRELRITVAPEILTDDELEPLADSIRDQVQEFSTYPGAIVVNVFREFQHSELKD